MAILVERNAPEGLLPVCDDPVLDRLYKNRGITGASGIDHALTNLLDYNLLKGIDSASVLLANAIEQGKRIVCVGDYDVDGATSTAIVMESLHMMGAPDARFIVPNRFSMGYGLSPKVVSLAAEHKPDLIITVDNGISSFDGAKAVKALPWGCQLVVTDHHLAPDNGLPVADAIVNPQQPGCEFPSKNIAGCGVAFMVMLATRDRLRERGFFNDTRPEPVMARCLDLVALGLVCDVVPLDYNNRVLIASGLKVINSSRCRPGIYALLEVGNRLNGGPITTSDLGFCVGPRLNAAGRLDDMTLGIHCLRAQTYEEARRLAVSLDDKNRERKEIEDIMREDAMIDLSSFNVDDSYTLVVFNPEFHEGVQGIVASRLKEAYYRPTICFSKGEDGMIKGSGRSIDGFHLKHALDAVVAHRGPGLIPKFGGHAMAAGLSIYEKDLPLFKEALEAEARRMMSPDDLIQKVVTDGSLAGHHISLDLAHMVESAGPWGQHFPEPSFTGDFNITYSKVLGGKHLKLKLQHDDGQVFDAIAFNVIDGTKPAPSGRVRVVYKPSINRFRGNESVQLMIDWIGDPCELTKEVKEQAEKKTPATSWDHSTLAGPGE